MRLLSKFFEAFVPLPEKTKRELNFEKYTATSALIIKRNDVGFLSQGASEIKNLKTETGKNPGWSFKLMNNQMKNK